MIVGWINLEIGANSGGLKVVVHIIEFDICGRFLYTKFITGSSRQRDVTYRGLLLNKLYERKFLHTHIMLHTI